MTHEPAKPGQLILVATPIGNLGDISQRALQVLSEADVIAAEDTRRTGRLLSHFGLKKPLLALHDHNESEISPEIVREVRAGKTIALVSDAGTPLISDPGFQLLREALSAGLNVSHIPGPSAVITALAIAGLPVDRFTFEGFLPARTEARQRKLAELAKEQRTMVFYESVHRIVASLQALVAAFGSDRRAAVCRELTKQYESIYRGTLAELGRAGEAGEITSKGEFVIVVEGARASPGSGLELDRLLRALLAELPLKTAVKVAAAATGRNRNEVYSAALEISKHETG